MNDYKPNSHRFKESQKEASNDEERKITKVANASVKSKKKGEIGKLASIFISEDVSNVKSYLLMDVLVPTVKKAILGAMDMLLNGGSGTYNDRHSGPKISYRQYYDDPRERSRQSNVHRAKSKLYCEDIVFETKGQAESVLDEMCYVVKRYGIVKVSDVYEMSNLEDVAPYTANKYGWTNLDSADTVRLMGGGYGLRLPKALPLD